MNEISEVISYFVENLNWTFIIICSFITFGIKFKEEFNFAKNWVKKEYISWLVCGISILVFSLFKLLESNDMTLITFSSYILELIRSVVIVVVFNSGITSRIFTNIKK